MKKSLLNNKKITTFFLVFAVLLIWGIIFYKIINRNPDSVKLHQPIRMIDNQILPDKEYNLLLNYPDPFRLSRKTESLNRSDNFVNKSKATDSNNIDTVSWPEIKYNGFVSSNNETRIHLTYNGLRLIMKQGESFGQQFKIETVTKDSILITRKHEKQWFKR